MQKEFTYYRGLLSDFIDDRLPIDRLDELLDYAQTNPKDYALLLDLPEIRERLEQRANDETIPVADVISGRIKQRLMKTVDHLENPGVPVVRRVHFLRRASFRWAAAAVVVFAVATIALVVFTSRRSDGHAEFVSAPDADVSAPVSSKAMITLADGSAVSLDSLNNGLLAEQGGVRLLKLDDGQIAYKPSEGETTREVQYNALYNPRGSKVIDMTLSDGSHVWLNAGSSITYPVAFVGNDRKVSIKGEAYFEVAVDASKPFFVTKGDIEVKVLGTHFNVNAYDDEKDIRVTLLEGSVKVSRHAEPDPAPKAQAGKDKKGGSVTLRPGQQALATGEQVVAKSDVDLDVVMAWKNGLFQFDYTPMDVVLKELSRWYNVDVVYEKGVPDIKLWGEMKRDLTLTQALKGLVKIGVKFRIDGKKLIVMP
ncbi:MAG: FecR domain-containing protein [Chitinophagaceae bacterium]|nr:FecR domain-containing protein [Chitinophagaceae bacterium]